MRRSTNAFGDLEYDYPIERVYLVLRLRPERRGKLGAPTTDTLSRWFTRWARRNDAVVLPGTLKASPLPAGQDITVVEGGHLRWKVGFVCRAIRDVEPLHRDYLERLAIPEDQYSVRFAHIWPSHLTP